MKRVYLALAALGLVILFFLLWVEFYYSEHVFPNTFFNGVRVSGMTREELLQVVDREADNALRTCVLVRCGENEASLTWQEVGLLVDRAKLLEEVLAVNNCGMLGKVFRLLSALGSETHHQVIAHGVDRGTLHNVLNAVFALELTKPQNAQLKITGSQIEIVNEVYGSAIDEEQAAADLLEAFNRGIAELEISLRSVRPEVTREDIEGWGIEEVIGEYTTHFNPNKVERTNNLKLCAQEIDGTVVAPGDVFDFNQITGPATREKGYLEAPIFLNGRIVLGLGGGKCQVSTTVYNAALLANLEIVERHQHGLPVDYVPPSRDAAVSYGGINLRFRNTSGKHIYVQAFVKGNALTVRIFGTDDGLDVEIQHELLGWVEPPVEEIPDPSLAPGQVVVESSGAAGYRSRAWKIVKRDGVILSRKLLSVDYYAPIAKRVRSHSSESTP